jgi:Nucleotidyl transferase AbiEii toxin, Type IV TA system
MTPDRSIDALVVLEAFHVRLLLALAEYAGGMLYLKGGVNLRIFFGSVRYSEDMDFDADPRIRDRLRRKIPPLILAPSFQAPLRALGLRGVTMHSTPQKATATTLRFKMGLELGGGILAPTKVEISFRAAPPPHPAVAGEPAQSVVSRYVPTGTDWTGVLRYPHASAIWQKLRALALRTEVQARDVFDLHHLMQPRFGGVPVAVLRHSLADDLLDEALSRTYDIDPAQFAEKVVRYLPFESRAPLLAEWDNMRQHVAEQIKTIRDMSPEVATRV